MGNIGKNKSRVCQIPPTLIEASGKWYQRPWTAIMSQSIQTKAASLQLIIASLYLFFGVVSIYTSGIVNTILFSSDGEYFVPYYIDTSLLTLFSATILPLVIGAIGLILIYGFLTDNKKSWFASQSLNLFGIMVIAFVFIPVLVTVYIINIDPSPPVRFSQLLHSYDSLWGILFFLVPFAMILNALGVYTSTRHTSKTYSGNNQNDGRIKSLSDSFYSV